MIDENKFAQYGFQRPVSDILGLTIHNTNNYEMTARDLFNWLNGDYKGDNGCHYLVDNKETIEVMPHDWAVYHTGKGLDYGNKYTIAIEICSNLNDQLYLEGQDRAIELIKQLMEEYNISIDNIFYHIDFNARAYCPATILDKYKTKNDFLNLIKEEKE